MVEREVDKKEVGKRIKQIRRKLGETAEVFGKRFDPKANRSLVSAWENGRYIPNPERLKVIAELGGENYTVNDLLYGSIEERVNILATQLLKDNNYDLVEGGYEEAVNNVIDYYKKFGDDYLPSDENIKQVLNSEFILKLNTTWTEYKHDDLPQTIYNEMQVRFEAYANLTTKVSELVESDLLNKEAKDEITSKFLGFSRTFINTIGSFYDGNVNTNNEIDKEKFEIYDNALKLMLKEIKKIESLQ